MNANIILSHALRGARLIIKTATISIETPVQDEGQ